VGHLLAQVGDMMLFLVLAWRRKAINAKGRKQKMVHRM
jgi:hypothetical protein